MGHEPSNPGIVTGVLRKFANRKLNPEIREIIEATRPMKEIADAQGWPKQWIVCPHCGQFSWRFPPHLFDPCPLVVEAAQVQGLKLDTERNSALRNSAALEAQLAAFQAYLDDLGGEDE